MVVSNLERPWFQNTVLLTLLFLCPLSATAMKALGREEKKKRRKTGTKGLAKLTAHYEIMIF